MIRGYCVETRSASLWRAFVRRSVVLPCGYVTTLTQSNPSTLTDGLPACIILN